VEVTVAISVRERKMHQGGFTMNLPDFLTRHAYGEIRLTGHRIGLLHVVDLYNEGYSPEMLLGEFPSLSLALIHKVIALYLENRPEVDAYISRCHAEIERQIASTPESAALKEVRQRLQTLSQAEKP
jgi:uncharacterized protein (DUF433 family)